ncbi:hypothetical protein [Methanobacterium alcaliphilum]|uniref:hypothetical protein n=1 Tax=Methanobacterium alcaliphilum TaxID=392018 RepID=UPI00200B8A0B|nr:hypothetical protein [Methanobacterium alcaliphilum]MCK9151733.1 hypothetical protein [Methanobacterium alcaliphilum]
MPDNNQFSPVSLETMNCFKKHAPEIIEKTVQISMKRKEEVIQHGNQAQKLLILGMQFTTKMLESALITGEISLLEDELKWAKDRLPHDDVTMKHVLVRLKIYRTQIMKTLPEECAIEIVPFIDWMIEWQETHLKEELNE